MYIDLHKINEIPAHYKAAKNSSFYHLLAMKLTRMNGNEMKQFFCGMMIKVNSSLSYVYYIFSVSGNFYVIETIAPL